MCQNSQPSPLPPSAAPSCACHGGPPAGRIVAAQHDLEMPAVPFPPPALLAAVGEPALRRLVAVHHERLRQSAIAELFPNDPAVFAALVERVADYVVEACGGPARFTPVHGQTCMRTRHFPFSIDEAARETWLAELWAAFEPAAFPAAWRAVYWAWMAPFSVRMVNRRTRKAQPDSLPWPVAAERFAGTPA